MKVESMRAWATGAKREVLAVWFAARDPRTPWAVRLLAMLVAAYALSPIDLIPDFIPVLGYLDDLLLVPLGVVLVIRLVPDEVMRAAREKAAAVIERPRSAWAAVAVVCIWVLLAMVAFAWMGRALGD